MDAHKWFKEAKYGMMVHWGLYSLLGGEYKGEKREQLRRMGADVFSHSQRGI